VRKLEVHNPSELPPSRPGLRRIGQDPAPLDDPGWLPGCQLTVADRSDQGTDILVVVLMVKSPLARACAVAERWSERVKHPLYQ
jgi:hypothetical protein